MADKGTEPINVFDRIKEWVTRWGKARADKGATISPKALLLLIAVGAGLMMLGQPASNNTKIADESSIMARSSLPMDEQSGPMSHVERDLESVLRLVSGVGDVRVMIGVRSSEQAVFAEEVTSRISSSQSMGARGNEGESENHEESVTRRPIVLRIDGGRTEEPLISHRLSPEISGVLVVAQGAKDERIRLRLLEAVSSMLDVPAYRVEIVPMAPR